MANTSRMRTTILVHWQPWTARPRQRGIAGHHFFPSLKLTFPFLLYTYRALHSKKDRDKNSLFALEKPADWLYDFFSLVKNDVSTL